MCGIKMLQYLQLGPVDKWAQDNATGYSASGAVREKMAHGIYTHLS